MPNHPFCGEISSNIHPNPPFSSLLTPAVDSVLFRAFFMEISHPNEEEMGNRMRSFTESESLLGGKNPLRPNYPRQECWRDTWKDEIEQEDTGAISNSCGKRLGKGRKQIYSSFPLTTSPESLESSNLEYPELERNSQGSSSPASDPAQDSHNLPD